MLSVTAASGFGSSPPSGPTTIIGSSANWTGANANFVFSGADISHTNTSTHGMWTAGATPVILVGNFTVTFTLASESNSWYIGVFATSEVGDTSTTSANAGTYDNMDNTFNWNGENTYYRRVGKDSTSGLTGGDILKIVRTNDDDIELLRNGSSFTDYSETYSGDMYVNYGSNNSQSLTGWSYVYNQ